MADFLIKNTNHWMDVLSSEQVIDMINTEKVQSLVERPEEPAYSRFEESYNTRYQKGDVIEVGPDNHWTDAQHGNGQFLIVRVPFFPERQAKTYMDEWQGVHRRRYRMRFETIAAEQIAPYVYRLNTIDELLVFFQDKAKS